MPKFPKTVLVDTGFWIALYEPRDQHHIAATQADRIKILSTANILLPWPCLYETFNTRFAKNIFAVRQFDALLRQPHFIRVDDTPYRDQALEASFRLSASGGRTFALVDMVLRLILEDMNIQKHGILTFNQGDFTDLCRKFRIEML